MGKIVSKRGLPPKKSPSAPIGTRGGIQTHILDFDGSVPLTAEEQEEIGRVFESIRRQLDLITQSNPCDWDRLCQPQN